MNFTRVGLLLTVGLSSAMAQPNLQNLNPVSNMDFVMLEEADLSSLLNNPSLFSTSPIFSAQYRFQNTPLFLWDMALTNKTAVVSSIHSLSLGGGLLVSKNLFLGADAFFAASSVGTSGLALGLGDVRAFAKLQLGKLFSTVSVSLIPEVFIPTGSSALYLSNRSFAPGLKAAMDWDLKWARLAANVGVEYFYNGYTQGLDTRFQLPLGFGAAVPVSSKLTLNLEATSSFYWPQGQRFQKGADLLYFGGKYFFDRGSALSIGATLGNFQPDGSASFGIIAGFKFAPHLKNAVSANSECGERPVTARFFARKLHSGETLKKDRFPYRSTKAHTIPTLQLGQMTGLAKGEIPYVYASQIVFAIDVVGLPPRNSIVGVEMLSLKMNVRKVARANYLDTEILCFVDEKICSGELYRDEEWLENINPKVFEGKETPNDFFTKQFLDREVGVTDQGKIFAADITLPLAKLLQNSMFEDPLKLIYKDLDGRTPLRKRTLYIVVADDTYVSSDAFLDVVLRENTCIK